ncbi:Oligoribonuclease, mitochondrial [Phlyctochytrium planicorne]|nr:Oligoribonuclease, mitochondrial [Phlyctochytrium planicorne]
MTAVKDPLVWIDLEMTGLNLGKDRIIEIDLVIHQSDALLDGMDEWCTQHHGESGLTAAVKMSTISTADAEAEVLAYIKKHVPAARVGVLAGNSIHVDKVKEVRAWRELTLLQEFLRVEMPKLLEYLHYRLVDVSTLKELARRWSPEIASQAPKKKGSHRALDDIRESIEELKFYREKMMKI